MAIVTFTSDFGEKDHYVAVVKAAMLTMSPAIQIVDISHQIHPFDIQHAGYVLSSAFRHFPVGTVHLIALEPAQKLPGRVIAMKLEDHYFVGNDTGIFNLLSEQLPAEKIYIPVKNVTFTAKEHLVPVAIQLAMGRSIHELGKRVEDENKLIARMPKLTRREMVGHVVRVDHYGNLITNLLKKDFDAIQKLNGNVPFNIQIGRENYRRFHEHYDDVDQGECYVLFNSNGNLQVGINKGNAAELLGLYLDYPVYLTFNS